MYGSPKCLSLGMRMRTLSSELRQYLQHLSLHGVDLSFATAMVLSGAAFRHYFFTPNYNHAWLVEYPDDLWREDSLTVENYGVYEAIEGHTGWTSRRWHQLKGVELVQLLRYEQTEGRHLRHESTDAHPAGLITGFDVDRTGLTLHIQQGENRIQWRSALDELDAFCAQLPALQSLRPVQGDIPATRRTALTLDVFRWAGRHWEARKEIAYDVQAFYAAGHQAWLELRAFYDTIPSLATDRQEAARTYVRAHLNELATARAAAAAFFSDHDALSALLASPTLSKRSTEELRDAWQRIADRLQTASDNATTDLVGLLAEAQQLDTDAFERLNAWTAQLHRVTTTAN